MDNCILQNYWKISKTVQTLEEQVKKEPISPSDKKNLHHQLEILQNSLEKLRRKAVDTQKQAHLQFDAIESQIISLYRKIDEKFDEHEIFLITKEAFVLSNLVGIGKVTRIAKQIHELRHHIHFLFTHKRPCMRHRKIINLILKMTDYAAGTLKGIKTSKAQVQLIHLLKILIQETLLQVEKEVGIEEGDLAMQLYEIADLIYRQKEKEAKLKLNFVTSHLTSAQQNRLATAEENPEELLSAVLEIADGDPCFEWTILPQKKESAIDVLQA